MGIPMIQVFMIAARQVSKPIAEAVIKYGKDHPGFRNRILLPIGRSMVHLTTRLRMKNLGLGAPTNVAAVSEATALEQAAEVVQQFVLFTYSVGVFAGLFYYQKWFTPETMKLEAFEKWQEENKKEMEALMARVSELEKALAGKLPPASGAPAAPASPAASDKNAPQDPRDARLAPSLRQRLSSLPIDDAARVVLAGEEYMVVRRGSSVGIEEAAAFDRRGDRLVFRKRPLCLPEKGLLGLAEAAVGYISGKRWNALDE